MTRKTILVEEAFAEWRKDPEHVAAYDALEEEFALASALIRAGRSPHDSGAGGGSDGHNPGCRRAPGEWTRHALDAHAPAVRQGDELPIEDHLRAGRTALRCAESVGGLLKRCIRWATQGIGPTLLSPQRRVCRRVMLRFKPALRHCYCTAADGKAAGSAAGFVVLATARPFIRARR